jgi:hypothetical protein
LLLTLLPLLFLLVRNLLLLLFCSLRSTTGKCFNIPSRGIERVVVKDGFISHTL